MEVFSEVTEWPERIRLGAVAIGNFDGVHLGHARIVERLIEVARRVGGPAVVFTFDPHPVRLLRPAQEPPPLTWTERKAHLLGELGVDFVIAYPTDEALLELSAEQFFDRIVREKLSARAMVEGPNFYFGHNRTGNVEVLAQLCRQAGMTLDVVDPIKVDGEYVSSSRVRKLLEQGRVEDATRLLTRPYRVRGMVTHGSSRGHRIGFPTANVDAIDTLRPAPAVYAGLAITSDGVWSAAINVGPNPTFGEQSHKIEVHLIGFHGNLYGQPLEVDFLARLRDIQRFDTVDALKTQLAQDIQRAEQIAARRS